MAIRDYMSKPTEAKKATRGSEARANGAGDMAGQKKRRDAAAKKKAEAAKAKKPAPAKAKKPAPAKAKKPAPAKPKKPAVQKGGGKTAPAGGQMKLAVMPSKGNASKTKKELKSKIERRTAKGKSADKAKAELKSKRKTDRKINKFRDQVAGTRRAQPAAKKKKPSKGRKVVRRYKK